MKSVHPVTPISQVTKKPTPIKAVLDLADVPPSRYRMPNDGRQWRHLCMQRHALVNYLAAKANPDGSSITVGAARAARALDTSRRTIQRWLADLTELGILENGNLTGNFGQMTRKRKLDVPAILARPVVADSPVTVVPSSPSVVQSSTPTVVPSSRPVVPSSQVSPLEDGTQPPLRPTVEAPNEIKIISTFVPPTLEQVKTYCQERNNGLDPEEFMDYYAEHGWVKGKDKEPITDWERAVRYWERDHIRQIRSAQVAAARKRKKVAQEIAEDYADEPQQEVSAPTPSPSPAPDPKDADGMRHYRCWKQIQDEGKATGENSLYADCVLSRAEWQGCDVRHDLEPATDTDKKHVYAAFPALARMRRMGAIQ